MLEFTSPIIIFGGWRKHFHDERGVEQDVYFGVLELRFTAYHSHIRIGVESGRIDPHSHISCIHLINALA